MLFGYFIYRFIMANDMITKADLMFASPIKYPRKKERNSKSGALLTVEEWKKKEVMKFVENLKQNSKYDNTSFW